MEQLDFYESGLNERQKSQDDGKYERLGTASAGARKQRGQKWPREARTGSIFTRRHMLRHDGANHTLETRSRMGRGAWIMVDGHQVVFGATEPVAMAKVIKAIDPAVEVVLDVHGKRLA